MSINLKNGLESSGERNKNSWADYSSWSCFVLKISAPPEDTHCQSNLLFSVVQSHLIYNPISPWTPFPSPPTLFCLLTSVLRPEILYHPNTVVKHTLKCVCKRSTERGVCGVVPIASLGQDITEVWNTSNVWTGTGGSSSSSSDGVCLTSEWAADRESSVFMFTSNVWITVLSVCLH